MLTFSERGKLRYRKRKDEVAESTSGELKIGAAVQSGPSGNKRQVQAQDKDERDVGL